MAKPLREPKATKPKRPRDINQLAHQLVRESTEEREPDLAAMHPTTVEISRVMAELGRRGGKIGGVSRAKNLTKDQRREIAKKAARARWHTPNGNS